MTKNEIKQEIELSTHGMLKCEVSEDYVTVSRAGRVFADIET